MFCNLVFKAGVELTVLESKAVWPNREKDHCKIRLTGVPVPGGEAEYDYVPKSQVDLAMRLKELGRDPEEETIRLIEELWEQAYWQGSSDEAMSNAGPEL